MNTLSRRLTVPAFAFVISTWSSAYAGREPDHRPACDVPQGRYMITGHLGDSEDYTATLWVTDSQVHMIVENTSTHEDFLIFQSPPELTYPAKPQSGINKSSEKTREKKKYKRQRPHQKPGLCQGKVIKFKIGPGNQAMSTVNNMTGEVNLRYVKETGSSCLTGNIKFGEPFSMLNDTSVSFPKK